MKKPLPRIDFLRPEGPVFMGSVRTCIDGSKGVAIMSIASNHSSTAEEERAIANLVRGMLLFIWCVVRVPIVIVLAFLEPFVRLLLIGVAVLSVLTGLVYSGSSVAPAIPFWVMACVSATCVVLLAAYQGLLRLVAR